MKYTKNEIIILINSLEKYFKIEYNDLKEYIEQNNYCYEQVVNEFNFTGYTELHDFFRLHVSFNELEHLRSNFYKVVFKETELVFYDFYDKILVSVPVDFKIDIQNVNFKAFLKFLKY